MALIHIKPAPGLLLRNHQRGYRPVPPEGEAVEDDFIWQKRLADGDAVLVGASGAAPLLAPSDAHKASGAATPPPKPKK